MVPLEYRPCKSWLRELEEDEVGELEPAFALMDFRKLAPLELDEMEASSERPVLMADESPAPMACTMA